MLLKEAIRPQTHHILYGMLVGEGQTEEGVGRPRRGGHAQVLLQVKQIGAHIVNGCSVCQCQSCNK